MPINLINLCTKRHNEFLIVPQLVEKAIFDFYASCGSTHSIEFALQIHKFREHVSRNLYKGRKNVSVGRGFSSRFARKRGFEREAVRKTKFFDSLRDILKSMSLFHTRNKRRNSKDYENISQTSLPPDCSRACRSASMRRCCRSRFR